MSTLKVNCPTCDKSVTWTEQNTFRPFCSERCKQIDLGAWASEEYAIAAEQQDEWDLQQAVDSANQSQDKPHLH